MEDNNLDIFYSDNVLELEDRFKFEITRDDDNNSMGYWSKFSYDIHNDTKIVSIKIYLDDKFIVDWKCGVLINIRKCQMSDIMCDVLRRKIGKLFNTTARRVEQEFIRYEQANWYIYD